MSAERISVESGAYALPTVVRRWPGPDAAMSLGEGCLDCFVGEPHVCPLLGWADLVITEDEYGAHMATIEPEGGAR